MATRKASQSAVTRKNLSECAFRGGAILLPKSELGGEVLGNTLVFLTSLDSSGSFGLITEPLRPGAVVSLSDPFVFLDQSVANGEYPVSSRSDVVLVRDNDNRIAFRVQTFEEIHNLPTRVRVERAGRFVCEQD